MIFYLAKRIQPQLASRAFLDSFAEGLAGRIQVESYDDVFQMRSLRAGTYIFSDLDRLSPDETERAEFLWQTLSSAGRKIRLLNRPIHSMHRYELLRELYERGINDFNVYRLTEARQPERFPVFVRGENDHHGPLMPLLHNQAQVDEAVEVLVSEGNCRENKIIVEFCDVADVKGLFHRFGAFIIGDEIVPRSALYSREWVVKGQSTEYLDASYIDENPHESLLRPIFETAGIQYGRIDYAVVDGQIRVFEINMNPWLVSSNTKDPEIQRANEAFARNFEAAMQRIDDCGEPTKTIPLVFPDRLGHRWRSPLIRQAIHKTLRFFNRLEYEDHLYTVIKKFRRRVANLRKPG